jgi:hypothetical protein
MPSLLLALLLLLLLLLLPVFLARHPSWCRCLLKAQVAQYAAGPADRKAAAAASMATTCAFWRYVLYTCCGEGLRAEIYFCRNASLVRFCAVAMRGTIRCYHAHGHE